MRMLSSTSRTGLENGLCSTELLPEYGAFPYALLLEVGETLNAGRLFYNRSGH